MGYWGENTHQTAKGRNNNSNMIRPLSKCCGKVQELSMSETLDGTSWVLPRLDAQVLEKPTQMRDTRSGTAEKTRNTSMGWYLLYGKKL